LQIRSADLIREQFEPKISNLNLFTSSYILFRFSSQNTKNKKPNFVFCPFLNYFSYETVLRDLVSKVGNVESLEAEPNEADSKILLLFGGEKLRAQVS
jgi:hypothetical protein